MNSAPAKASRFYLVWGIPPKGGPLDEKPLGRFASRDKAEASVRVGARCGWKCRVMVDDESRPDFGASVRI